MIRIGPSKIHGQGVFATMALRRGDLVGAYTGRVQRVCQHATKHFLFLDGSDEYGIEPDEDCPLRYLNAAPTAGAANLRLSGLLFYARRPIRKGEELTFHYEWAVRTGDAPA